MLGLAGGLRSDHWNLLLIVDETMTGMGRTGKLFAIEHYDVVPDIIVMGKALGAYCPLAATIFSERVSHSFDHRIFGRGQSYSGHALACAGALAALQVLCEDGGLLEHTNHMATVLEPLLRRLGKRYSCVGDVRGLGLFWTIELTGPGAEEKPVRHATEKYGGSVVEKVAEFLLRERNVYVPSDKFGLWIVPPLVINREEIDFLMDAIKAALDFADSQLGHPPTDRLLACISHDISSRSAGMAGADKADAEIRDAAG